MVIDTFEGEFVRHMRAKLPAITMNMPEGFPRGTHVRMEVEARVRSVSYPEATDKEHKGDLVRLHEMSIVEVAILGHQSADEADPGVGGSASRQVEERDDFGEKVQDCWYDPTDLILYHRGGCDLCYKRVPEDVVLRTVGANIPTGVDESVGF